MPAPAFCVYDSMTQVRGFNKFLFLFRMSPTEARTSGVSSRVDRECRTASILRNAFDIYDKDRSRTIDENELRKMFEDLGWPTHGDLVEKALNHLDEDMSGEISFSEFLKWTEFAYAFRIVHRSAMVPSPPRQYKDDTRGQGMQAGNVSGMGRRWSPSLRTVVEEGEFGTGEEMGGEGAVDESVGDLPACQAFVEQGDSFG